MSIKFDILYIPRLHNPKICIRLRRFAGFTYLSRIWKGGPGKAAAFS